jgi:hypothetical protein
MSSFSIDATCIQQENPVEGPIPMAVQVTMLRESVVQALNGEFFDIQVGTPPGWEQRATPQGRDLDGRTHRLRLEKGRSFERIVYLHDVFSSISPGRVELPVTAEIWLENRGEGERAVAEHTCVVEVSEPDPAGFAERIREIRSRIDREEDPDRRLELYRSLASLEHPDLVSVFLIALLDHDMLAFHPIARDRAAELAETYGRRDLIIRHLAVHGGPYDERFFRFWDERDVRLSPEEISQLSESTSLWVRLFCLERYDVYNRRGAVESLATELEELRERLGKLRL